MHVPKVEAEGPQQTKRSENKMKTKNERKDKKKYSQVIKIELLFENSAHAQIINIPLYYVFIF